MANESSRPPRDSIAPPVEEQPVSMSHVNRVVRAKLRRRPEPEHFGLNIERAAFTNGESPYKYMEAYGADLLLSTNAADVRAAVTGWWSPQEAGQDLPGAGFARRSIRRPPAGTHATWPIR